MLAHRLRGARVQLGIAGGLVGWLLLLLALVGMVSRYLSLDWQPAIVAAALSPFLSGAALLGLVAFVLLRRPVAAVLAVVLVLVLVVIQAPRFISSGPFTGQPLVLLQANLGVGRADARSLVNRVRADNVEVLTVEELTPAAQDGLVAAGLNRLLPYRFSAPFPGGGAGTGIWSRYPLSEEQRHEHFASELLSAQLLIGGRAIRLFAVHLQPPWPYPPHEWQLEIDRLRALIRAGTGPVVVSGDFNSGLDNAQFRSLTTAGFRDAAEQSGSGALLSYPTDRGILPLLALDHVLLRDAHAGSARTTALPGSDHRALLVRLLVPPA